MIPNNGTAELWNIVLEINQILALLVRNHIVKMNIFVTPFEVVDDAFVSQLLLDDKDILEEIIDALIDVKMIELCNHGLLIFQVTFIGVNECITLVNDASEIFKSLCVRLLL